MELLSNLALGMEAAVTPANLMYCFLGAVLGTLIGVLPGIGPTATVAMLLPLTFTLDPLASLIMLAGIYYGAQYGGSTTAILINVPGEASAAVTALDGHQMARQGRAGPALAIAAIGSFIAGTLATFLVALMAKPLTAVALEFGPPEYFALVTLGLISSVALAHGSIVKALAAIAIGILFGTVGADLYTGAPRFTFGVIELTNGFDFVAMAIGLFGIAEILRNLEGTQATSLVAKKISGLMPTRADLKASISPIFRGSLIGSAIGILPGGGAALASFLAYSVEKKLSDQPERFGRGAIEGVAGPESANNAGAQTSFIPMLTLGIPTNPIMALMIGVMMIQGIIPGPSVAVEQPTLFWGVIASMWVGNMMLLVLNLPLVGLWARLLLVPYSMMFPAILVFSAVGLYTINSNSFDLYTVSMFGLLGYVLYKLDFEPAPLLLAFVLGPMLEDSLRRSLMLSQGDPSILFTRPISATLLAATLLILAVAVLPFVRKKREVIFEEEA
ncbi:MAG: tripartite tricarboxylate transporter permease [Bradyrhizobiaceae bacterium]|nr:tripartite tricarboxylate transporter permease [Bradyrhizobiaceae bacterium]